MRAAKIGGKQKPVDAVEQSAMTRDHLAHVLGSEAALHPALNQVTHLAGERKGHAHQRKPPGPRCSLRATAKA